jgi:PAS domain S-box-containing protein
MTFDDFPLHPELQEKLDALGLGADSAPGSDAVWREFLSAIGDKFASGDTDVVILDENFDNLVSHAVDAFVLHDTRGRIVECNQATCDMLGYSREELLSMGVADFEMELEPGAIWDDMSVDEVFTVEGTHRRKDGSTYPVETRVGAFEVDDQKIILALCRDITERKEAEEKLELLNRQLIASRDKAVRAHKAKSSFLANMSHELRTPLNAIIGYSELLIEDMEHAGDDAYVDDVNRVLSAGRHLLLLINDVLDLSKIEAGKTDIHLSDFDITEVVEDIGATIRPLAGNNNNALVVDIEADLGQMCSDSTKVRQILLNLLSNACKFTSEGQVRLVVDTTVDDEIGECVRFGVEDSGIGMTEEQLQKVFNAFEQADTSTTRKYGGTGLGLAITRKHSEMLGGRIDVESEYGVGTTFTLVLPFEPAAEVDEKPAADADASRLTTPEQANQNTVLVIEDDDSARELLVRMLHKEGYHVVTAKTGASGLELARELRPHAITLDVLMPEMDGWTVLSKLKADDELRDIPVILLSMVDERKRGFALGADHYLLKPVERAELIEVIDAFVVEQGSKVSLLVEDDLPTRELMARILEQQGWRVLEASNGREGLDIVEQTTPDVVFLDLMMPEVDGFEFLSRFRQDSRFVDVPVVVVTAKELTKQEEAELHRSTSEIIGKASRGPGELLAEVRRALRDLSPSTPELVGAE